MSWSNSRQAQHFHRGALREASDLGIPSSWVSKTHLQKPVQNLTRKNREFLNPLDMDCLLSWIGSSGFLNPSRSSTCTKHALEGTIQRSTLRSSKKNAGKNLWENHRSNFSYGARKEDGEVRRISRPLPDQASRAHIWQRKKQWNQIIQLQIPSGFYSSHHPNPKIPWSCCAVVHLEPQVSLHSVTTSS